MGSIKAFRIVEVASDSPAQAAGLQPWLDCLIPPSGCLRDPLIQFPLYLQDCAGSQIELEVYSIVTQTVRSVKVKLNPLNSGKAILGAQIRYEDVTSAHTEVVKVLKVGKASPAEYAGLREGSDFLIGSEEVMFKSIKVFQNYISENVGKVLHIQVYNREENEVREVLLKPHKWKGPGYAGCEVGTGLFNQVSKGKRKEEEEGKEQEKGNQSQIKEEEGERKKREESETEEIRQEEGSQEENEEEEKRVEEKNESENEESEEPEERESEKAEKIETEISKVEKEDKKQEEREEGEEREEEVSLVLLPLQL